MTLEKLLNILCEKGWKPFYVECNGVKESNFETITKYIFDNKPMFCIGGVQRYKSVCIRQLVSKESGLWQFCVKNRLVKEDDGHIARIINLYKSDESIVDGGYSYHYWLMICSILDESEIKDFLLDNIKLNEERESNGNS